MQKYPRYPSLARKRVIVSLGQTNQESLPIRRDLASHALRA
jgi:hypothetical protein